MHQPIQRYLLATLTTLALGCSQAPAPTDDTFASQASSEPLVLTASELRAALGEPVWTTLTEVVRGQVHPTRDGWLRLLTRQLEAAESETTLVAQLLGGMHILPWAHDVEGFAALLASTPAMQVHRKHIPEGTRQLVAARLQAVYTALDAFLATDNPLRHHEEQALETALAHLLAHDMPTIVQPHTPGQGLDNLQIARSHIAAFIAAGPTKSLSVELINAIATLEWQYWGGGYVERREVRLLSPRLLGDHHEIVAIATDAAGVPTTYQFARLADAFRTVVLRGWLRALRSNS